MTLIGKLRARREQAGIEARRAEHRTAADDEAARAHQLGLLNREWRRLVVESPYIARLHAEGRVPGQFHSLEQFIDSVPATTRPDVQAHAAEFACRAPGPEFFRTTGGSTAQPIQMPAWMSELEATRPDMWLGRGWYGITPASRLFLLWGHSHLLGTGFPGWLRSRLREAADHLLGYKRVSAYDLRPEKLRLAGDLLVRHRPEYLIGYAVALDLFAQANADRGPEFRNLGLKVVIGTAESFPSADSVARLEQLFGCPVGMEYGAVETGLIAHTTPAGGYEVFWNSYLIDAEPSGNAHRLYVTSLYPRCFPLVRYLIGDEINLGPGQAGRRVGVRWLQSVAGRCNDGLTLESGAVVHSELFSHAVRTCPEVHGFQVIQSPDGVCINYLADGPLSAPAAAGIRGRLGAIHPSLGDIPLNRVERLEQTIAGKTRMVIRR